MTCSIDHDAENAIPLFLCVACNRDTALAKEKRQALDMTGAMCVAVEQVQALEQAAHIR